MLEIFTSVVEELRGVNNDFIYLCDPVLGDNGLLYVPEEMVEGYRKILHIPNILTPNQFELELLTGLKVHSLEDALTAIDALHKLGPRTIVLTSSQLGNTQDITCNWWIRIFCIKFPKNCSRFPLSLIRSKFTSLDSNFCEEYISSLNWQKQ